MWNNIIRERMLNMKETNVSLGYNLFILFLIKAKTLERYYRIARCDPYITTLFVKVRSASYFRRCKNVMVGNIN